MATVGNLGNMTSEQFDLLIQCQCDAAFLDGTKRDIVDALVRSLTATQKAEYFKILLSITRAVYPTPLQHVEAFRKATDKLD